MHTYYIIIVGALFFLAVSLLVIGVSNDAVNFLNSAIGSRAASFTIILAIAAMGILTGAISSNGMMEVARKGIFHPEYFAFNEIIVIFISVMLTNILLLDFFNTMGLPTSTTISIVFGILGAAVAVSVIKIIKTDNLINAIENYINISSSLAIIIGIFLSVIIAFNAGIIVQWIVRLAFTFNIKNTYRFWAGIWGGFALSAILYFLIIKGAKGSTLLTPEALEFIKSNTLKILLISMFSWTVIFQILIVFTRINILKITVLAGTFALAMAFAGNDLVNFIGVPLAGFESFKAFVASGSTDAGGFMMDALREPVDTPVFFLISAGIIMILALRFSKKAKSVTATTLDLSRQDEGSERFSSSTLARLIVRVTLDTGNIISKLIPENFSTYINKRFCTSEDSNLDKQSFDLVRASVNLVVASILISIGTSFKLPLSTTYVTFMVAMGTSLADGAWGRDSAVYRITGVLTVIGGWFFTAFSAFLVSFIIALIVFFGKLPVILIMIGLSFFFLVRTNIIHRKKEKASIDNNVLNKEIFEVLEFCHKEVIKSIELTTGILNRTYEDFFEEKLKKTRIHCKEARCLAKDIKVLREEIPNVLNKLEDTNLVSGHHYVEVIAYMKEMSNSLTHIIQPAFSHLNNNYPIDKEQTELLKKFNGELAEFMNNTLSLLDNRNYINIDELVNNRDKMINRINDILLYRIKILKKTQKGAKISITYMEMLSETKNLLLSVVKLVKADALLIDSATLAGKETVEHLLP